MTKRGSSHHTASRKKRRISDTLLPVDETAVSNLSETLLEGVHESWLPVLKPRLTNADGQQLLMRLFNELEKKKEIFPPTADILKAFRLTPLKKVKVVILGQDPYHNVGQAMGLAFSVPQGVPKMPPSLPKILQEAGISKELAMTNGDLTTWAQQGVLLLNPVLTVERGQAASHQNWGWQKITNDVLSQVSQQVSDKKVVFLLWGNKAAQVENLIDSNKHLVLKASHPSPLATRGNFVGCQHFQKANECLLEQGLRPINWNSMNDPEFRMHDGELDEDSPAPLAAVPTEAAAAAEDTTNDAPVIAIIAELGPPEEEEAESVEEAAVKSVPPDDYMGEDDEEDTEVPVTA